MRNLIVLILSLIMLLIVVKLPDEQSEPIPCEVVLIDSINEIEIETPPPQYCAPQEDKHIIYKI